MADLTAPYDIKRSEHAIVSYPVTAGAVIYDGAFVEIDGNGYAKKHAKAAGATLSEMAEILPQSMGRRDARAAGNALDQARKQAFRF
ncbi:MAG: hypothetical protein ACK47M_18335 [Caldilinea sp.]